MAQKGLALHTYKYMTTGAFPSVFFLFFLILLFSSAAGSAGSYSFLCHLLTPGVHNLLGSDLLLRFSPFIHVGYLVFQSLLFEDNIQFGLISGLFITLITVGFSAVATSSVPQKYKKDVLKGHSRIRKVSVLPFSSSSLSYILPFKTFLQTFSQCLEKKPSLVSLKKIM